MNLPNTKLVRSEGSCRLLKITTGEIYYVVGGNKPTEHFNDYGEASEAFNLHWMQEKYGDGLRHHRPNVNNPNPIRSNHNNILAF